MPFIKDIRIFSTPVVQPPVVTAKMTDNFGRALRDGETEKRFTAAMGDADARWATPTIANGVSLDFAKTNDNGLSGSLNNLRREMGIRASILNLINETLEFLGDPTRFAAAIEKLDRRYRKGSVRGIRISGGVAGLQRLATAGLEVLAGDARGPADTLAPQMVVTVNTDPRFSVFRSDVRKTAIAAGSQGIQQALTFVLLGLEAGYGAEDPASPMALAIAQLQTRIETTLMSLADPSIVTIAVRVLQNPVGVRLTVVA